MNNQKIIVQKGRTFVNPQKRKKTAVSAMKNSNILNEMQKNYDIMERGYNQNSPRFFGFSNTQNMSSQNAQNAFQNANNTQDGYQFGGQKGAQNEQNQNYQSGVFRQNQASQSGFGGQNYQNSQNSFQSGYQAQNGFLGGLNFNNLAGLLPIISSVSHKNSSSKIWEIISKMSQNSPPNNFSNQSGNFNNQSNNFNQPNNLASILNLLEPMLSKKRQSAPSNTIDSLKKAE